MQVGHPPRVVDGIEALRLAPAQPRLQRSSLGPPFRPAAVEDADAIVDEPEAGDEGLVLAKVLAQREIERIHRTVAFGRRDHRLSLDLHLDDRHGDGDALADDSTWVSVTATGQLIRDRAVLDDLGDPVSDAWFEDGKDPIALQATMHHVDWWDAPGKVGQIVGMAKGVLGDGPPDVGDRGEIN